jgi:hypothetical protein
MGNSGSNLEPFIHSSLPESDLDKKLEGKRKIPVKEFAFPITSTELDDEVAFLSEWKILGMEKVNAKFLNLPSYNFLRDDFTHYDSGMSKTYHHFPLVLTISPRINTWSKLFDENEMDNISTENHHLNDLMFVDLRLFYGLRNNGSKYKKADSGLNRLLGNKSEQMAISPETFRINHSGINLTSKILIQMSSYHVMNKFEISGFLIDFKLLTKLFHMFSHCSDFIMNYSCEITGDLDKLIIDTKREFRWQRFMVGYFYRGCLCHRNSNRKPWIAIEKLMKEFAKNSFIRENLLELCCNSLFQHSRYLPKLIKQLKIKAEYVHYDELSQYIS